MYLNEKSIRAVQFPGRIIRQKQETYDVAGLIDIYENTSKYLRLLTVVKSEVRSKKHLTRRRIEIRTQWR